MSARLEGLEHHTTNTFEHRIANASNTDQLVTTEWDKTTIYEPTLNTLFPDMSIYDTVLNDTAMLLCTRCDVH